MTNGHEAYKKFQAARKKKPTAPEPSTPVWPTVSTQVTQGVSQRHTALDIGGNAGAPIFAVVSGRVVDVKYQPDGYGLNVRVIDQQGREHIYAHLQASSVNPGDVLSAGQVLGEMGSTGHSTGPHLHYEVRGEQRGDRFRSGHSSAIGAIDPRGILGANPEHMSGYDMPARTNWFEALWTKPSEEKRSGNGKDVYHTPIRGHVPEGEEAPKIGDTPGWKLFLGDVSPENVKDYLKRTGVVIVGVVIVWIAVAMMIKPAAVKVISSKTGRAVTGEILGKIPGASAAKEMLT